MRRNVYTTARLFSQGGRPLCTEILPGQDRPPSTIFGLRKLDTGLPDGKDHIPLHAFPRFDTITECDGQTDGRICRGI